MWEVKVDFRAAWSQFYPIVQVVLAAQQMHAYLRRWRPVQLPPKLKAQLSSSVKWAHRMLRPVSMAFWKFSKRLSSYDPFETCNHGWCIQNRLDIPIRWENQRRTVCKQHLYLIEQALVVFDHQFPAVRCSATNTVGIDRFQVLLFSRATIMDSESKLKHKNMIKSWHACHSLWNIVGLFCLTCLDRKKVNSKVLIFVPIGEQPKKISHFTLVKESSFAL